MNFADILAGKGGCSQGGEAAGSWAPAETTRESQQVYKARRAQAALDSWRKVCKALETSVQGILNARYARKHAQQISPLPLPTSTRSSLNSLDKSLWGYLCFLRVWLQMPSAVFGDEFRSSQLEEGGTTSLAGDKPGTSLNILKGTGWPPDKKSDSSTEPDSPPPQEAKLGLRCRGWGADLQKGAGEDRPEKDGWGLWPWSLACRERAAYR